MNISWELQKAVYTALSANTDINNLVEGVFDYVPEETNFPYIVISGIETENLSNLEKAGYDISITFNMYSRAKGKKEVADIIDKITAVLGDAALTLSGGVAVFTRNIHNQQIEISNDGKTFEGVLIYKFYVR